MPRPNEVSIWVTEFVNGTLPQVCAKSGKPATSKLKFRFGEFTYGGARFFLSLFIGVLALLGGPRADGSLPLTSAWRRAFLILRVVALISFPAALFTMLVGSGWKASPIVAFSVAIFAVYVLSHMTYATLRPKGTVHRSAYGSWIDLRDVHPNFVEAVQRMEANLMKNRGLSPDGDWYWDGSSWLSTTSPDGKWRWDGLNWRVSSPTSKKKSPQRPSSASSGDD